MGLKQEEICRLCLKIAKNEYKDVDETVKLMFNMLFLNLDLDIARDPIVCQDCLEVAKMCLNFKYAGFKTERIILSFAIAKKKDKYDMTVICKEGQDVGAIVDDDFNICRFCMTCLGRNDFVSLDILMNGTLFDMLPEYVPEMDFNIIENPKVCTTCRETLEVYFQFVLNCLDTEVKIKSYCKEERKENMYQIKLSNVVGHFLFKVILEAPNKCPQTRNIKQESNKLEDTDHLYPEVCSVLIKQEKSDIKEEETKKNVCQPIVEANIMEDDSIPTDYLEVKINESSHGQINHNAVYTNDHQDISEIKILKCLLCTNEYKYKKNFEKHTLVHRDTSEMKMFTCSLCAYKSKYISHLKTHMLTHKDISEINTFKCSLCTYEGKQKIHLTQHMFTHQKVSELKMYKCSFCTYETKYKYDLKSHMLVHKNVSEIKMHKCVLCTYETKRKGNLKTHMSVHKDISETKIYKCYLCAYEVKQKKLLIKHMLVHKKVSEISFLQQQKIHKCSLCTYETKYKGDLKSHMLVHMDVSKISMFKCYLCGYQAKRKCGLLRHMLIHKDISEIKMYKCLLCAYEGREKRLLKSHMLHKHKHYSLHLL